MPGGVPSDVWDVDGGLPAGGSVLHVHLAIQGKCCCHHLSTRSPLSPLAYSCCLTTLLHHSHNDDGCPAEGVRLYADCDKCVCVLGTQVDVAVMLGRDFSAMVNVGVCVESMPQMLSLLGC